jgi:isopropylmalate/homocitrate/citramalate synthase
MAIDWTIQQIDPQPDGKKAVAYIGLQDGGVTVGRISVEYSDAEEFKKEVQRKTEKFQESQTKKESKTAEAEQLLSELRMEKGKEAENVTKL